MVETVCIFEDPQYVNLLPLVYTRPVYDLRCGILTLRQKIERCYPKARIALLCRPYLADVVRQQNPETHVNEVHATSCLIINGRVLAGPDLRKKIPLNGQEAVYISGNTVVAVRMHAGRHASLKHSFSEVFDAEHFSALEKIEVDVPFIHYPWELVHRNGDQLRTDFASLGGRAGKRTRGRVYPGVHRVNQQQIVIHPGAVVKPGVVLDAERGPICIGENATILPNAVIEGPAFIGANTLIKAGAKIYENTTVGEWCKVGGEVEASIIHSHSNKQHDGFVGHSYIGSWCNLGADTNTSDLKNNYGNVHVQVNGKMVDSGLQFVGLMMADHAKSGINTMFNTGTVVGVASNVFGSGFPPKFIPSFAWGGAESMTEYEREKALDVARRVMKRRNVEMSDADATLLRKIFDLTAHERRSN